MPTEPEEERCDVTLGYQVTRTAFEWLRSVVRELEDRGLKASRGAVLDHLIKRAKADDLAPHFPKRRR
jgi:phosphoribulokinase